MPDTRKTVLITGAGTGGIGGSLAKEFHAKGYRVFATARNLSTIEELSEVYAIETIHLDVTSTPSVRAARDEVARLTGGRLDVLVNNAGLNIPCPATDLEIDTIAKSMFEVNVYGVMRMVQEFVHLLIAAEGTIVNIGSVAGVMPYVFGSAYNATKGAVHSYGDTLRVELKPFNVKVMTIVTGGVTSNIARHDRSLPPGSLYTPILSSFINRLTDSQDGAISADTYARSVVAQVAKSGCRRPIWFWEGNKARFVWFLRTFLWSTVFDHYMMRKFGLYKLREIFKATKNKND